MADASRKGDKASDRISVIALLGAPIDIWPVAAALSQTLPDNIELIIVEDKGASDGKAVISAPAENALHTYLGLTVTELMRHCKASLSLGVMFNDWGKEGFKFFAAPSGVLPRINGVSLHHIFLRAAQLQGKSAQLAEHYEPFRFCANVATAGKFAFHSTSSQSPRALLGPLIHLEANTYIDLLKVRAKGNGITLKTGAVKHALCKKDGVMQAVILENGEQIEADFFIDVSGQLSSVYDASQPCPASYSPIELLPFDEIARYFHKSSDVSMPSFGSVQAIEGGVEVRTPLRQGEAFELLFSGQNIGAETLSEYKRNGAVMEPFKARCNHSPWVNNFLRMGRASLSLGPIFSVENSVFQADIMALLGLIPTRKEMNSEVQLFNERHGRVFEEIRDFVLLPFALTRNLARGEQGDDAGLPDSLQRRIALFKSRGLFTAYDNEVFDTQLWIDMMIGFGVVPKRYDPRAEGLDLPKILPTLMGLNQSYLKEIQAMADHNVFMEKQYKF